jgi:uncharacterized RDD family membrane protein YckC
MTQLAPESTKFGHFAGPVTRALAYIVDVALSAIVFAATVAISVFLLDVVTRVDVSSSDIPTWLSVGAYAIWLLVYFGGAWAASGKTAGMALVGIRVVARDGTRLGPWQGLLRAPALALSLLTFGIGLIGIVIGREHRGLQDVLVGSVVVYDWDARVARLRFLARHPSPSVAATADASAS